MKVLVISGSPRGQYSVTLQSMLYLQKFFDDDEFSFIDAATKIKSYEKDFSGVKSEIAKAEAVVVCYPVYTCLAPSQLHRFFELAQENGVSFAGKAVTQFTTSKHFFDMTAHGAVEEILRDLGGNYVRGMSADMNDLTLKKGQEELVGFWKFFKFSAERGLFLSSAPKQSENAPQYTAVLPEITAKNDFTVALVTNCKKDDTVLTAMISDFCAASPFNVTIYNLAETKTLKGGCLGCLNCTAEGNCVYNDGFQQLLRDKLEKADAMVYAFSPRLHTFGADFKMFDDRRFCNGHRTTCVGKPTAYIVGGSLVNEPNLRQVLDARPEIAENYPCGIVTTDGGSRDMQKVIATLEYAFENKLRLPVNFYGEGGRRIFRDLVYVMRGIMKADDKFYKAHGFYDDLPNRQKKTVLLMKLAGVAFNNKKLRRKLGGKMNDGMLLGHKKAIANVKK